MFEGQVEAPGNLDFRLLNTFETPKVFLTMFLEDELTRKTAGLGLKEVFSGEPLLSPLERTRLSDRVKASFGLESNRAMDAFLEVATNPLSYLAFLPGIGSAARVSLGKAKYSAWMKKNPGTLMALGGESAMQAFRGTTAPALWADLVRSQKAFSERSMEVLTPGYQKLMATARQRGVRDLVGDYVRAPGVHQDYRRKTDALLQVYLEGLNKDVAVPQFRGLMAENGVVKLAKTVPDKVPVRKALISMTDEQVESGLKELGAWDFAQAIRADQQRIVKEVFGATRQERIDNASRMYFSMRGVANSKSHEHVTASKQALQSLFGKNMEETLATGKMKIWDSAAKQDITVDVTEKMWQDMVEEAIDLQLADPYFVSRNQFAAYDPVGRVMNATSKNSALYDYGLIPTGRTMPRTSAEVVFGEDDLKLLQQIQREATGTDAPTLGWAEQFRKSTTYNADIADNPNIRRRLNVIDSHSNYVKAMNNTHALFVEKISEDALILEKEILGNFREELAKQGKMAPSGKLRTIGLPAGVEADDIMTAALDSGPGPRGGYTRADLLDRSYKLIDPENGLAKDMFKNGVMPHMLGEMPDKSFVGVSLATKGKDMARWFVETPLFGALKAGNANMAERVRVFAQADLTPTAGSSMQHAVSSHLYGALLGLNIKSVIFNLTQPLITMPAVASLDEMLTGYTSGIKKMTGYFKEAFETPGAFTNQDVARTLRRKHFDLVGGDTGDLLGLTDDLMDQLDIGNTGAHLALDKKMGITQKVMIPFQQGEMSNRVISAEIIRAKLKKQGLDPLSKDVRSRALARAEIQTMVEETQFGSSGLNTLMAAYGQGALGGILKQPVLRQFFTFPFRMMTLPLTTLPSIAERPFLNTMSAAARTVGYSAIGYELLRSDLIPGIGGTDASDFLYVAATTQLISGVTDPDGGPIPTPPIIGIGSNLLQGMTQGDFEVVANEAWKALPGGLAIGRAVKSLDPMGLFMRAQERPNGGMVYPYNRVDWQGQDENGYVPIYDPQGRLLTRARPLDLVLQSAGLDMDQFQNTGELDNFLVKQREQMVEYERRIVNATLNGDHGRAQQVALEFQKRFGFMPKIERSQFQTALRNKQLDRTERILTRMDPQIRELYGQMAGERRGLAPQTADNEQLRGEAGVAQQALNDIMMRIGG
jgi:hypothetical protein